VEEGLDIGKGQAYIIIEESCNAQTIKVKEKFHWRLKKQPSFGC
jgi:hypothetical protein